MTPEHFRQLEELYHAARDATTEERAALLAKADPELRRRARPRNAWRGGLDAAQSGARACPRRTNAAGANPVGECDGIGATGRRPRRVAIYQAADAVCEAHFGNTAAAKERAGAALQIAKGRDVEYAAAYALALSGDIARSQSLADDLAKRFPEDTPVQFEYLPTLRALFALTHREAAGAVERLQVAIPYDSALPGTAFFAKFGGLYPAYVRGQAYLEARRGPEAAAEFRKVLDHRGIVLADPIGALAHLQLGRAYLLSGDRVKAKTAYQEFLTLWKDADTELPVFQRAREEYARL
jgi:tetratricopeptide (TPR) repeat protein